MWKTQSSQFRNPLVLWQVCKLVFVLFVLIATSGCKGLLTSMDGDPLADRSFLTGKPCEAPCWQGLRLDKSSEKEILDTLNELPFINASSIYTFKASWLGDDSAIAINYECTHPVKKNCGTIRVSGNKLKSLNQTVGFNLTLETVVNKLGQPDYMDYGPIHIDIGGCVLSLYWPEQNIIVEVYQTNADTLCREIEASEKISPKTLVTNISYSVKQGFGTLPEGCCKRKPWPGFVEP